MTWQFNEQDGHRDFFWGHYHNEPGMAERDLHNRAEDYQRRYHVFEVEQAPDKETYKYYSTQRPIDIGTYPNSYFNRPVHMDLYFTRLEVTGEAFQACGAITYAQPLTEREMQDYELRPSVKIWTSGGRWMPRPRCRQMGDAHMSRNKAADLVLSRLWQLCGESVCHPGAAYRPRPWGGASSSS